MNLLFMPVCLKEGLPELAQAEILSYENVVRALLPDPGRNNHF